MDFMPRHQLGRRSVWLGSALAATVALELVFAVLIGGDAGVIERSAAFTVLAGLLSLLFIVLGVLSFLVGAVGFFQSKDWRIVWLLAGWYGLSLALFVCGEVLFPH